MTRPSNAATLKGTALYVAYGNGQIGPLDKGAVSPFDPDGSTEQEVATESAAFVHLAARPPSLLPVLAPRARRVGGRRAFVSSDAHACVAISAAILVLLDAAQRRSVPVVHTWRRAIHGFAHLTARHALAGRLGVTTRRIPFREMTSPRHVFTLESKSPAAIEHQDRIWISPSQRGGLIARRTARTLPGVPTPWCSAPDGARAWSTGSAHGSREILEAGQPGDHTVGHTAGGLFIWAQRGRESVRCLRSRGCGCGRCHRFGRSPG